MGFEYSTLPKTKQNNITQELKQQGYTAVETPAGKLTVTLKNGKTIEFESWEPVWTVLSRIHTAEGETNWAQRYHEDYERHSELGKKADKRENTIKKVLKELKHKFYSMLGRYNVDKAEEIADSNIRDEAIECQRNISISKRDALRASNEAYSYYMMAFDDALSENKFSHVV